MDKRNDSTSPRGNGPRSYADKLKGGGADDRDVVVDVNGESVALDAIGVTDVAGSNMVQTMTAELAAELHKELSTPGAYAMSPVFISLKPGQVVRGVLVEAGKMEITDTATKQLKDVGTWTLEDGNGFRCRFLTAHQLDQELNVVDEKTGEVRPRIGAYVIIAKLEDEKLAGGRNVGRFRVAIKKATPAEVADSGVGGAK